MQTNKCPNCSAVIELNAAQLGTCVFCGFSIVAQNPTQVVHVVKQQNNEFESQLAFAENVADTFFRDGPKSVRGGDSGQLKGFNAVMDHYADAEIVGANESKYWISLSRFYAKAILHELAAGRMNLHCSKQVHAFYTRVIDLAIKFALPQEIPVLEQEKQETINKLNQELPKYKEKTPGGKHAVGVKGCYVATSVYGSYDCPEVWTLRRYRDHKLATTKRGRSFIKFYYAISPGLIKVFGKTRLFRFIAKKMLDRKVRKLQAKGFASSPYDDGVFS